MDRRRIPQDYKNNHPIPSLSSSPSITLPASPSSLADSRPITPANCLYIRPVSSPSPLRSSGPHSRPKLSIVIPQSRLLQSLIVAEAPHPSYQAHPYLSPPFNYCKKSNGCSLDRDREYKAGKPRHISVEYWGRDIMEVDLEGMSYAAKCAYSRQSRLPISTITLSIVLLIIFLTCISLTSAGPYFLVGA
ncbi:hypothetical protein C366_03433 [Cryptococcus neoformans Tu401-1]|nr:hypothetical protein C365_03593 [Cryptococcus neoformans var. grubii Bt85]OXG17345.1 hypothetical protein C366_03433 [Cryptococcus neoformans var. grubii Tu401-1]